MACMEGVKMPKKLEIDYNKLIDDKPPMEFVVITTTTGAAKKSVTESMDESLQRKTESELKDWIVRNRVSIPKLSPKLPDHGEKLKLKFKLHEDELERRKNLQLQKEINKYEEAIDLSISCSTGAFCGIKEGVPPPIRQSSKFGSLSCSKLNENKDSRTVNAFDEEITCLSPCDQRRMRLNGQSSARGKPKSDRNRLAARRKPFRSPNTLSVDVDEQVIANGRHPSTCSPRNENVSGCLSKRKNVEDSPARNLRPRNAKAFVLVDEEEHPQRMNYEDYTASRNIVDSMKEIEIYYPSRDDPKSVVISVLDMECLAPEAFLSSPIINFYIRYLQNQTASSKRARLDNHFFNTFFYSKLKEAMDSKQNERETLFVKFRRWWKGVNIFEKAYILLPVHEYQHWSLVIICFQDKEDESGPILLHLDSLGLHHSSSIFKSIKSFLKEEWNYLRKEAAALDPSSAGKIWENLPRQINEKIITVPQQRNGYDCGLFVLFFMERFIDEAPKRLKKKDLEMFGKKWFEPEEASGLRNKIRRLLLEEFMKAREKRNLETEKEKLQPVEI